jgi:hypothetical protein
MRFRIFHRARSVIEFAFVGTLTFACTVPTSQYGHEGQHGLQSAAEAPATRRIHITDRYGERFDITHAVEHYNMSRRGFEFGIGKNTIRPLSQPRMLTSNDRGYPATGSVWNRGPDVIGLVVDGEARSYPVDRLVRHEVVNEIVGATEAAVAY